MKVYLVYDHTGTRGVFATYGGAEAYRKKLVEKRGGYYWVSSWEVDE